MEQLFFVLQRVLLLKSAIIKVCRDRVWGIDFDWAEVKKIVLFLKPLAMATTYLEGDKYPTAACVIPSILSLQEHFTTNKEKEPMLKRLCDLGLFEMKKKFEHFMDGTHPQFDQTYLMCCILHPSKTLELNGELFEEGKRRMYDFLKQEVIEGLCLLTISNSEEEDQAPNPNNQPQSTKGYILFLQLIFTFFNCLVFNQSFE